VGNFRVKIRHKATYVDHDKCTGCGLCWESCPARKIPATRVIRKGKLVIGRVDGAQTDKEKLSLLVKGNGGRPGGGTAAKE
jgi:ferredoxin